MEDLSFETSKENCWLLWDDCESRNPEFNIAIDDLLLREINSINRPILRIFKWDRPCVSFGRNQDFPSDIPPEYTLLRRSTGGGIVFHDKDLTYSLIFPAAHPFLRLNRLESYRIIHEAIAEKLPVETLLKSEGSHGVDRKKMRCFDSPSRFDIVAKEGQKFAGAAQRRTRQGLLHQGSVVLSVTDGNIEGLKTLIGEALSSSFEVGFEKWQPAQEIVDEAKLVAKEFYLQEKWNNSISCRTQLKN